MKILFFLAFIVSSDVVAVASNDHRDHDSNKGGSHLRATKGSANVQATSTSLLDVELESDSSTPLEKENKSYFVPVDETMYLDEEMELALQGLNEANRNIQLAAYMDYMVNHMSMEEINLKYRPRGHGSVGVQTKDFLCCKNRNDKKCFTQTDDDDTNGECKDECKWREAVFPNIFNGCCAPENRGKKFWVWEDCK